MTTPMPLARTNEIIVQEVDNECLVYDLNTNKALCLNTISAEIWKRCDGIRAVQEVAEIIGKQMNIKLDEDFIWLAIADLEKNKLLENKVIRPTEFENLSRRKVLFKYALPSLMLPVIASIVAPTAVNAQSGGGTPTIPLLGACPTGSGCAPGLQCLSSGGVLTCCAGTTGPAANTPGSVVGGCFTNGGCATASQTFCCSGMAPPIVLNPVCPNAGEGRCTCA